MTTSIKLNSIPYPIGAVITLGRNARVGALSIGAAVLLEQNTAPKIETDLFDLAGDPDLPENPGKQALYAAAVVATKDAHAAKNAALSAGRAFCRLAIDLLKPTLGERWNTAWQAAGFHLPSLAVPRQPVALLNALRNYFHANPARENLPAGITKVAAQAAAAAIDAAVLAVGAAKNDRVTRKAARDLALKTLRQRLSGLRSELDQLLADDAGEWYEFGFRRPIDGKQPTPVTGLVLTPLGAGSVLASWAASSNADDYRVSWRLLNASSGEPAIQAGLVAELQFALTGLPSGEPIAVTVSARNSSGETTATEAQILVP